MSIDVSIIMPAYNAARHIAASIASVQAQTFNEWELIVIDDGSMDETACIVKDFAAGDKRIKLISQANGGQGAARNAGLVNARAEFVAFLDADDLWLPNKLELQIEKQKTTNADVIFSDSWLFLDENTTDETEGFATPNGFHVGDEMLKTLIEKNAIPILTVVARRAAIENVGRFDESRLCQNCEDYDLWMRLAANGATFYGINQKLARYRRHVSSSSALREQHNEQLFDNGQTVKASIYTLEKYLSESLIDVESARLKIISLLQTAIVTLCKEGKYDEAAEYAKRLLRYDRRGFKSQVLATLVRVSPQHLIPLRRSVASVKRAVKL